MSGGFGKAGLRRVTRNFNRQSSETLGGEREQLKGSFFRVRQSVWTVQEAGTVMDIAGWNAVSKLLPTRSSGVMERRLGCFSKWKLRTEMRGPEGKAGGHGGLRWSGREAVIPMVLLGYRSLFGAGRNGTPYTDFFGTWDEFWAMRATVENVWLERAIEAWQWP